MAGGSVKVVFADGSSALFADDALVSLCDALWERSSSPGAVAIIGMLEHERRHTVAGRREVRLNKRETEVLLAAQRGARVRDGFPGDRG